MPSPVWEIDACLLNLTAQERGVPIQPRLLLVVEQRTQLVLFSELFPPNQPLAAMVDKMLRELPPAKTPRIRVRQAALAELLAGAYRAVEVVADLPLFDTVVAELEAQFSDGPGLAGYWADLQDTYPAVADLMQEACDYYRARPWRRLDDDDFITLRWGRRQRYLSVMGSMGRTFGLALFLSKKGIRQMQDVQPGLTPLPNSLAVTFDDGADLGPAMRKDLRQHYPIAGRHGFPFFMRSGGHHTVLPNRDDLDWIRLGMQAVPVLLAQFDGSEQTEINLQGQTSTGSVAITVRFPTVID